MDPRLEAALRETQQELLPLLTDAVRVLEKHQLPYSLICGTLLGAIRHKGFIPWDDDIDLVLPRQSYDRFAQLYPRECAPGFYLDLQDTWVPRVKKQGGGHLAFVDLFVLDPLPDGKPARLWKLCRLKVLQGMLKEGTEYSRFSFARRLMLRATALMGKPFTKAVKLRWYGRVARGGSPHSKARHMANGAFHLLGMAFAPEDFENPVSAPFEGLTLRIPRDAPRILTMLYGPHYMTPPPEAERLPQHLKL